MNLSPGGEVHGLIEGSIHPNLRVARFITTDVVSLNREGVARGRLAEIDVMCEGDTGPQEEQHDASRQ